MKWIKKILISLVLALAAFVAYALFITRHAENMTVRQRMLKAFYPAFMWATRLSGTNRDVIGNNKEALVDFYSLKKNTIDGKPFDFSTLKGKKVLIVNTASDCGYTGQYEALEKLYQRFKGSLEILAFPANDFKEQEKESNENIAAFCKKNYGLSFPVMEKCIVIKSAEQDNVFRWLTQQQQNGWNEKAPAWNFSKYLVDERGNLIYYFGPSVSPLDETVTRSIEKKPG